jgi:hypothetical protein
VRRIVANLLWEDDLAPRRTTPPRTVLETASGLGTLLRVFAQDGDHLWTPSPVDPERVLEVPGVSRPILESGPLHELPPADEVLAWAASSAIAAAVHHRAFCLQIAEELGCVLPGSQMVGSLPALDRLLSTAQAPRTWVLKAPLSASGRNRYIERNGPGIADPRSRRRVEHLFESHGLLLFEPWMNRTADFGVSAHLDPAGLSIVGIHGQKVDIKGQFAGIDLQPVLSEAERARLIETVESVGAVLQRQGYMGPFGIDAWRYRKESGEEILHPLGEINARMTFGLIAWAFAERVEGAARLRFGRNLPVVAETAVVPLLAPGPDRGSAAWLEL